MILFLFSFYMYRITIIGTSQLKNILKNKKGSQDLYKLLISNDNITPGFVEKWNVKLGINIDLQVWNLYFKTCFKVTDNVQIQWF